MLGFMRQREPGPVLSHDVNLVVIPESEIRRTPIRELWRRLSDVINIVLFCKEVLEAANEPFWVPIFSFMFALVLPPLTQVAPEDTFRHILLSIQFQAGELQRSNSCPKRCEIDVC